LFFFIFPIPSEGNDTFAKIKANKTRDHLRSMNLENPPERLEFQDAQEISPQFYKKTDFYFSPDLLKFLCSISSFRRSFFFSPRLIFS